MNIMCSYPLQKYQGHCMAINSKPSTHCFCIINQKENTSIEMQSAALTISPPNAFPSTPPTSCSPKLPATSTSSRFALIRTNALAVNYNSKTSVFPAEACETIGGDACIADAYPEVKPKQATRKPQIGSEQVERDYLDYADPRTVLLGDACDVLGGEFCESQYQVGIFPDPSAQRH